MAFVTVLCLISFSGGEFEAIAFSHIDKVVHFTFYFVAAILGSLALREIKDGKISFKKTTGIIFVLVALYGIVIEVIQYSFTTDRSGDVYDAITNAIGALVGIYVLKFIFSRKTQLKWKN